MATPAQIAANRLNAQKSTGPRTPEGKAASRFNAFKHGLDAESAVIPGEDPAEYEALAAGYHQSNCPQTPAELFHLEAMINADWSKRRLQRIESELYRTILAESKALVLPSPSSPTRPRSNSSPAFSASSLPSNAPGTAPTANLAATATPGQPMPAPSSMRSSAPRCPPRPLPRPNRLRSRGRLSQPSRLLPSIAAPISRTPRFASDAKAPE